jgi:post-segregation antitoxin (ccd killing protein)
MIGRILFMTRIKISATIAPELIAQARAVVASASLSELLDRALEALVERENERRWLDAHDGDESDVPTMVPVDLSHIPWEDE